MPPPRGEAPVPHAAAIDHALKAVRQHSPHTEPSLPDVPKRASVALVVARCRTSPPAMLFIQRAARKGDRWSAHIALPGGRREHADADDRACAERETLEEVGLDLASPEFAYVGALNQQWVSTQWGSVKLLVLCPFVYCYTGHDLPPVKMQASEVAACHWVPLANLLDPAARSRQPVDVSTRLARTHHPALRFLLRHSLGPMLFDAVRLEPIESVYGEDRVPLPLLWGLTHAVLADFLALLPPFDAFDAYRPPSLAAPDVRVLAWLFAPQPPGPAAGRQMVLRNYVSEYLEAYWPRFRWALRTALAARGLVGLAVLWHLLRTLRRHVRRR